MAVYTLADLSVFVGGRVYGEKRTLIKGLASLVTATEGKLACFSTEHQHAFLEKTKASGLLTRYALKPHNTLPVIIVQNPIEAFASLKRLFASSAPIRGVDSTACIASDGFCQS